MDRKILVGSIIAVAILIGISFTSVVGYSSVRSTTIAETSPLFNIRTNRAIGEESKELTCKYVGKGSILPFPERDDKAIMLQKAIDIIGKMDVKTFERFIEYIINNARKDSRFNDVSPDEIREAFNQLKDSDKSIPILDADTEYKYFAQSWGCPPTYNCPITFGGGSFGLLVCILLLPLLPFLIIYYIILYIIENYFSPWPCRTATFTFLLPKE